MDDFASSGAVEITGNPVALEQVALLRVEVWKDDPAICLPAHFARGWFDQDDERARHWAIFDAGERPIAAARITFDDKIEGAPEGASYLADTHLRGPFGCHFGPRDFRASAYYGA